MAFKAFDDLLQELRDKHNQELDELRLQLESKDDEITHYKLRVKQLEIELKVDNNEQQEEFAIKLRSISTQTVYNIDSDHNDSEDNQKSFTNYSDPEECVSHTRRPGRPPARKATRKLIVSQRRHESSSPIPSSSTKTSKNLVLSETELKNHIQNNIKRVYHSSDDNNSDDKDISFRKRRILNKNSFRKLFNKSKLSYSLSVSGRKRDKVWQHFEDLGQSINGRFRRAKCVYCEQEFHTSKANLMVKHLANKCNLCPKHVIDEYLTKLENDIEVNTVEKSLYKKLSIDSGVRSGGRPRGKAWEHFEDLGRSEHGTFRIAKCFYCNTVYPISKLKLLNKHLAKECVLCPIEVMNQFRHQLENNNYDNQRESIDNEDNCDDEEVEALDEGQSSETELKLCGRRRAKVWEHYKDMGRGKHGSFRKAKCVYCNALFPLSRLTSMTRHLAKCCVLCPKEVVNEYLSEYNNYCQKRCTDNDIEFIDCTFDGDKDSLFYEEDLNPSSVVGKEVNHSSE